MLRYSHPRFERSPYAVERQACRCANEANDWLQAEWSQAHQACLGNACASLARRASSRPINFSRSSLPTIAVSCPLNNFLLRATAKSSPQSANVLDHNAASARNNLSDMQQTSTARSGHASCALGQTLSARYLLTRRSMVMCSLATASLCPSFAIHLCQFPPSRPRSTSCALAETTFTRDILQIR